MREIDRIMVLGLRGRRPEIRLQQFTTKLGDGRWMVQGGDAKCVHCQSPMVSSVLEYTLRGLWETTLYVVVLCSDCAEYTSYGFQWENDDNVREPETVGK